MKVALLMLLLAFGLHAQEPTKTDAAQNRAVAKDQVRQDKADARQNVAVKADNAVQDAKIAKVAGRVDAISDRQFMLVMTGVIALLLVAIWLLLQRGASRQHAASVKLQGVADILMERTEAIAGSGDKKIVD